jgi:alkylation response protein AidB-like acyl-CoA dehydrogenase
MSTNLEGLGLSLLNRLAGAEWPDRWGLRKSLEQAVYRGSKSSYALVSKLARELAQKRAPSQLHGAPRPNDLFDLGISEEQQMVRDTLRRFATEVLRPAALDADETGVVAATVRTKALSLGLLQQALPEEGAERSMVTHMLVAEELARGDMGLAVALLASVSAVNALVRWATPAQKAARLPAFAGDSPPLATVAVNEPTVLFDPKRLATRAQRKGAHWLLTGSKALVPLASHAELLLVAAQTAGEPGVFLVDRQSAGIELVPEGSMGVRAAGLGSLRLDRAPAERLGDETFDYPQFVDLGILAWCALAVGTSQAVLEHVIPYCNDRVAFGEPISHRQAVAFTIADMAIELDAMRLLTSRAVCRADRGLSFQRETYLTRLFVAEKAMQIGTDGVQLLGGHGYTKEEPVERWFRDLRAAGIAYGLHL